MRPRTGILIDNSRSDDTLRDTEESEAQHSFNHYSEVGFVEEDGKLNEINYLGKAITRDELRSILLYLNV